MPRTLRRGTLLDSFRPVVVLGVIAILALLSACYLFLFKFPTGKVPALMYHSVNYHSTTPLVVTVDDFDNQMKYLYEHRFTVITSQQLEDYLLNEGILPEKPVLITFDDGNMDNVAIALPILKKYNFTATEFVVGNYINKGTALTQADIKVLDEAGWNIGNHTFDHFKMSSLGEDEQKLQIDRTNEVLHKALPGKNIRFFSYPVGKYNDRAIRTLKDRGFKLAFTTQHGWINPDSDPYTLPRINIGSRTTLLEFMLDVNSPYFPEFEDHGKIIIKKLLNHKSEQPQNGG